jgi:hypothetical protein
MALELLRVGTFLDSQKQPYTFTLDALKQIADSYNSDYHVAPILVNHDETKPNKGLIDRVWVEGDRLFAEPRQVDPELAELTNAGRWPSLSPAIYLPDSPTNPVPGSYGLRHVAMVQIPAIKGGKRPQFAEAEHGTILLFTETESDLAALARAFREFVLGEFDGETADRYLPAWMVDGMNQRAIRERMLDRSPEPMNFSEEEGNVTQTTPATEGTALPPESEDYKRRMDELTAREAALAAREAELTRAADTQFVEGAIASGKVPPFLKERAIELLGALPDEPTQILTFAEGGKEVKATPKQLFREMLGSLRTVQFGEVAPESNSPIGDNDPAAVAAKARRLMTEAAANGETLSPAEAVIRAGG